MIIKFKLIDTMSMLLRENIRFVVSGKAKLHLWFISTYPYKMHTLQENCLIAKVVGVQ